jgi:hypothetical protein
MVTVPVQKPPYRHQRVAVYHQIETTPGKGSRWRKGNPVAIRDRTRSAKIGAPAQ